MEEAQSSKSDKQTDAQETFDKYSGSRLVKDLKSFNELGNILPKELIPFIEKYIKSHNKALNEASIIGDVEKVKSLLENKNINVNKEDWRGDAPLVLATENYNVEIAKLLLEHGANPNQKNNLGHTPLMKAGEKGLYFLAGLLIEHKADLDAKDFGGETTLMKACKNGHYELVELLVNAGAQINLTDNFGQTALAYAVYAGDGVYHNMNHPLLSDIFYAERDAEKYAQYKNIIKFLISKGARGALPYHIKNHDEEIVMLLRSRK